MLSELADSISALELYTDSSAAKSFVSRRGLSRMRHVEVKELWLQEVVKVGTIKMKKVPGTTNPADLLTKYHDIGTVVRLSERFGLCVIVQPRASLT